MGEIFFDEIGGKRTQHPNNRLDQWLMWTIMAAICGAVAGIGLITGAVITKERLSS
jgi:hypothetical protein